MDYRNKSYDQVMNQKIQMIQEYSKQCPQMLIISQIPQSRTPRQYSILESPKSNKVNTPQFSEKKRLFHTYESSIDSISVSQIYRQDHSTLTSKLNEISRTFEQNGSVNSSKKETTFTSNSILKVKLSIDIYQSRKIEVNHRYQTHQANRNQSDFMNPIVQRCKYYIQDQLSQKKNHYFFTYNAEEISAYIRLQTQNELNLDFEQFNSLLVKMNIIQEEDSISNQMITNRSNNSTQLAQQLTTILWNLFLILIYGQSNWQSESQIQIDDFELILLILFESTKNSLSNDFSSLELNKYLESKKIGFRSISHLNRYLFDLHYPSYDKTIALLKNQLQNNNGGSNLFSFYSEPQRKFSPNELEFLDQLNLVDIQNTPGKNERYKLLFQHAQLLQAKQQTMPQVREKEDLKNCTFSPVILNRKKKENFGERLSKQKKNTTNKVGPEEDISECTFKPKINEKTNYSENENVNSIKGVENQVYRYQQARQLKQQQEKFYEQQNEKLKQKNQCQTEAFQLSGTQKIALPLVYLDVKVSKGKTGRLAVRRGDNIDQLVRNFTKTYQLSSVSQSKLRKQIEEVIQMFYKNQYEYKQ